MSKKDSKILFLDDDGQEIEFNVIEQTTIAGQTYLLVEDCEASSEDESVVLIMKEVQLEDDYVSYEIVEDDKEPVSYTHLSKMKLTIVRRNHFIN